MKVSVDPDLMRATAQPLRRGAAAGRDLARNQAGLTEEAAQLGSAELATAVEDFAQAWRVGFSALADAGLGFAELLDRAAQTYHEGDQRAKQALRDASGGGA